MARACPTLRLVNYTTSIEERAYGLTCFDLSLYMAHLHAAAAWAQPCVARVSARCSTGHPAIVVPVCVQVRHRGAKMSTNCALESVQSSDGGLGRSLGAGQTSRAGSAAR